MQKQEQSQQNSISIRNLCKDYGLGENPISHLLKQLTANRNLIRGENGRDSTVFSALKDISFELPVGRSLGVIGLNGSGKSTLLQIIAGTLTPTTGEVQVNGRVGALLELGSGFNPDFTGRENIRINGNLFGLTNKEIESRMDSILAFADIGKFANLPSKTYSSGMLMRLAFAVVAHISPDVLLIDEALSVGDFLFQLKCLRAMKRLQEAGCSFLLVSHSMDMIQEFCDDVLFLDRGQIHFHGSTKKGIELYEKYVLDARYRAEEDRQQTKNKEKNLPTGTTTLSANLDPQGAEFLDSRLLNKEDDIHDLFRSGEPLRIELDVRFTADCPDPHCGVKLKDSTGRIAFGINTYSLGISYGIVKRGEEITFAFNISQNLTPGKYTVNFGLASGGFGYPRVQFENALLYKHDAIVFTILRNRDQGEWSGPVLIPTQASCKILERKETTSI